MMPCGALRMLVEVVLPTLSLWTEARRRLYLQQDAQYHLESIVIIYSLSLSYDMKAARYANLQAHHA